MDLVLLSLKDRVYVKCRFGRELRGKLVVSTDYILTFKAYDEHLNLMLNDVEEKITTIDIDPLTKQEQLKIQKKAHSLIFMRGDLVISISPTPQ
jgi:U6 snRNA-associated Sm-like protein LSm3